MAIDPSVGPVTKVWHTMTRAGKNLGHFNSDLIFVDGVPTIVVEWLVQPDGDIPKVTIPLDPQFLRKLRWEDAEYLYEFPVEDPRRLS
jgi:hypothetical protein